MLLAASGLSRVPLRSILKGLGRFLAGFWRALGQLSLPFSKAMRSLLQGSQHGIHIGISLPPCSAAVRAQHMESKKTMSKKDLFQDTLLSSIFFDF